MSQALATQTLRLERLLPGPIERVWEYLTRIPACMIGICTSLIAAFLTFMFDGNAGLNRQQQTMGIASGMAYERVEPADPPS